MEKKKIAIGLNIVLIILELIGIILTIKTNHKINLYYYTEDSNLISFIASSIFLYFLVKGNVPKKVQILKFISVVGLMLTFLVVIFVLIPMYDWNFKWLLFEKDFIFFHLLCPIVAFVSFVFFEKHTFDKRDSLVACSFTILYSIALILLNVIGVVEGPYPFLRVREQSIIVTILWAALILGSCYVMSIGLKKLKEIVGTN